VCEYWHSGQQRWRLIDAQIDSVQQGWFGVGFDVAREEFLVAGQAWRRVPATVRNAVLGREEPLWPATP
jgi:hypothetical protein